MPDPRIPRQQRQTTAGTNRDVQTPFSNVSIRQDSEGPLDLAPYLSDARRQDRPAGQRIDWYEPPTAPSPRTSSLRLLPRIGETEPIWKHGLFILLALAICGAYLYFLLSFWAPAPGRSGVDENAYLLGGRNLADHHSTGFKPASEFQYVGLMWVQSPKNGWYYPKYSAGQSVLNAVALKVGGAAHGTDFAFLINPVCTTLALLATFFLVRSIAGSFWGLLGMLLLGFGYTTLERANNPDSHASALFFVTAGMYLFLRWWQTGSTWRGIIAGLLLGFAVTVRFNEAMLLFPLYQLDHFLMDTAWWKAAEPRGGKLHWIFLLVTKVVRFLPVGPIGIAAILSMRWRQWRSYLRVAIPLIAWAIPVAAVVWFNYATLGTMSGYDLTHESEGFSTHEFLAKWQFSFEELYRFGLFLTFPLGVAGLALMFRRSLRTALFFTLWFLPGALLYVAYYWGNHMFGVGYLRFYLSFFPPMIAAALWLICSAGRNLPVAKPRSGSIAVPLGAGILTAAAVGVGAMICLQDLEIEQRHNIDLAYSGDRIVQAIARTNPDKRVPIAFCDEGLLPHLLQFMQFRQPGDWFSTDAFDMRFNGAFGVAGFKAMNRKKEDANAPVLIQQSRIDGQNRLFHGMTPAKLIDAQHELVKAAIDQHRPVYAVLTPSQLRDWKKRFLTGKFEAKELDQWTEPCAVPSQEERGPLAPPSWPDFLHRGRQEFHMVQVVYKN